MNHEEIEKQAKTIMDAFLKELKVAEDSSFGLQRTVEMRAPLQQEPSEQFRNAFFANAPKVKDNLLQMERKQW